MSKESINELYANSLRSDRLFGENYYGEFLNWGYWKLDTETQVEACRNLVELVLGLLPAERGQVLEVGCGIGGVIGRLLEDQPAAQLTAINIVEQQLAACRRRYTGVRFLEMDAVQLAFEPSSFDTVLSIEAAMHFDTRERFFGEALRVLRPGGYLALADIIGFPLDHNYVANPAEYAALLRRIGFGEVRVTDVTTESSQAHADRAIAYLQRMLDANQIDHSTFERAALSRLARVTAGRYYVIAVGRKPLPGRPLENRQLQAFLREFLVKTSGI